MNRLVFVAATAALIAAQSPANAVVISVLGNGVTSIAAPTETFDGRTVGAPAIFGPGGDGGAYLGSGIIALGDIGGVTAAPFYGPLVGDRDPTPYLSIGPGHPSVTIDYVSTRTLFGLYWGSVDSYNTVQFFLGGSPVVGGSFTGDDITPLLANGNQDSYSSNRYVIFSSLAYDRVVLGSNTAAFEIDNIASAVPEPATWALMLIGFGGIAFMAYRRARRAAAVVL